jgi:dTDP-4-amino-4,6-dideoxygalactose transaminase
MKGIEQHIGNIPTIDLRREYHSIEEEVNEAIRGVLASGWFISGENVKAFEREFAQYCGVKFGVGVASGTDALQLALRACGVEAGDEVITVSNTSFATAIAISYAGAKPVFVDIDETYTMDVSKVEKKITPKTKAILPVHLYGQPADIEPVVGLARKHNLRVIEDACQAHGTEYKGKKVGSFGDVGCFSFYPTKNLGAYGDGGMVITNNEEIAQKLRLLKDYGQVERFSHIMKGYNSRLDELQAAILRVKLKKLDMWNKRRCRHAELYNKLLAESPVITPVVKKGNKHVYHQYVIRTSHRDHLQKWLKKNGVGTDIHYPTPIHLQPAYAELGLQEGALPVTEQYAKEILSLPMNPELKSSEIEQCCKLIQDFSSLGPI